ncbi:hypothetical protein DWG20_03280 [Crenobacter cavernae]|uniref:Chemotaxis protein n=2 Tax=Crenobacter cavernae TaxID=2290923 RepID=A0A345Y3M3_9NEIS|nr:hypothetical protein DWG20_03280 [Crenobacter cavernae]
MMAEPVWMSYIGLITGAVGTVTGIYGAITGSKAIRLAATHKALDLRLKLEKALVVANSQLDEIPDLLRRATASRNSVLAAAGAFNSGTKQLWDRDLETDQAAIASLKSELETVHRYAAATTEVELAQGIGLVHALAIKISQLESKYTDTMVANDVARRDLEAARSR